MRMLIRVLKTWKVLIKVHLEQIQCAINCELTHDNHAINRD